MYRSNYWLKIIVFIFISLLLTETNLKAEIIPFSLKEMVSASELVVFGEVVDIKKRKYEDERFGQGYLAKIRIKEILKKEITEIIEPEIDVSFLPGLSIEPRFNLKEKVILFLGKSGKTYHLVQGYAGKVTIEDGAVYVQAIYEEPGEQSLKGFLEKIRDTKSWHNGYR